MPDIIFASFIHDLKKAIKDESHPFRHFTLGTVSVDATPRLRTVVLREVDNNLKMRIYTDRRSVKVSHIARNNKVSLLFYHPDKLQQLSIQALGKIVIDPITIAALWKNLPEKSRKDYTTCKSPGDPIKNPKEIDYLNDQNYFSVVDLFPERIEFLKLKRPNHIRVSYRPENGIWKSAFLVP